MFSQLIVVYIIEFQSNIKLSQMMIEENPNYSLDENVSFHVRYTISALLEKFVVNYVRKENFPIPLPVRTWSIQDREIYYLLTIFVSSIPFNSEN